mmetsp:Transcript_77226/g.239198  ORF Transcript_77226/g.239198 Transcript_77226/m.239198 type:complete len:162 (-) Transcript_77226:124-609(-)
MVLADIDGREQALNLTLSQARTAARGAAEALAHVGAAAGAAAEAREQIARLCGAGEVVPGNEELLRSCPRLLSGCKQARLDAQRAAEAATKTMRKSRLVANSALQALLDPAIGARPPQYNAYIPGGPPVAHGYDCHMHCARLGEEPAWPWRPRPRPALTFL